MKKHEIIKFAYDNYPKGTKFKNLATGHEVISSGNFEFNETGIFNSGKGLDNAFLYGIDKYMTWHGKWAEIVKPKIAVKVENEKEFRALMKYYDSLGYFWEHGEKPNDYRCRIIFPCFVPFENKFVSVSGVNAFPDNKWNDYQIIPFSEFAEQNGIKLPLLISEDGLDLYEDSDIHIVWKENFGWSFDNSNKGFKCDDGSWYVNPEIKEPNRKIFSTKQAALSWIEAHKPKETVLEFGAYKFTVKKDSVNLSHGDIDTFIDIKSINEAIFNLQK